jgi:hypothetical protein
MKNITYTALQELNENDTFYLSFSSIESYLKNLILSNSESKNVSATASSILSVGKVLASSAHFNASQTRQRTKANHSEEVTVTLSQSRLRSSTLLSTNSIKKSVAALIEFGFLRFIKDSSKGKVFELILSPEVLSLIKKRKQYNKIPHQKNHVSDGNSIESTAQARLDSEINDIAKEIEEAKALLAEMNQKLDVFKPDRPLKELFKWGKDGLKADFNTEQMKSAEKLSEAKQALSDKLKNLTHRKSLLERSLTETSIQENKHATQKSKIEKANRNINRNIKESMLKSWRTQIKKLEFVKSDSQAIEIVSQIVWQYQYGGWSNNKDIRSKNAFLIAKSLITKGTWRTPSGFNPLQTMNVVSILTTQK